MTHPVGLRITDDLRRSRLSVLFRLLLAIPHFIWLAIWGIAVVFAVIASWFATLANGTTPAGLHRFIGGYLRYGIRVHAYLYILADPFPAFGTPSTYDESSGAYPLDARIAAAAPQDRLKTGFRLILAIPALIVAGAISYLSQALAVIAWVVALFTAAVPEGVRNLGAWCLRFQEQTYAYALLLTDQYPSFGGVQPE
ncbi:MAG: DUF4389 domain-containing protein [Actinobacteria bacterium]|nr:DUF4389 domain-containing protein [Actinomycetota bacterium]